MSPSNSLIKPPPGSRRTGRLTFLIGAIDDWLKIHRLKFVLLSRKSSFCSEYESGGVCDDSLSLMPTKRGKDRENASDGLEVDFLATHQKGLAGCGAGSPLLIAGLRPEPVTCKSSSRCNTVALQKAHGDVPLVTPTWHGHPGHVLYGLEACATSASVLSTVVCNDPQTALNEPAGLPFDRTGRRF